MKDLINTCRYPLVGAYLILSLTNISLPSPYLIPVRLHRSSGRVRRQVCERLDDQSQHRMFCIIEHIFGPRPTWGLEIVKLESTGSGSVQVSPVTSPPPTPRTRSPARSDASSDSKMTCKGETKAKLMFTCKGETEAKHVFSTAGPPVFCARAPENLTGWRGGETLRTLLMDPQGPEEDA